MDHGIQTWFYPDGTTLLHVTSRMGCITQCCPSLLGYRDIQILAVFYTQARPSAFDSPPFPVMTGMDLMMHYKALQQCAYLQHCTLVKKLIDDTPFHVPVQLSVRRTVADVFSLFSFGRTTPHTAGQGTPPRFARAKDFASPLHLAFVKRSSKMG